VIRDYVGWLYMIPSGRLLLVVNGVDMVGTNALYHRSRGEEHGALPSL